MSMGNVAASGGYWVATPADFIFAEPSTITGSIGVFGILPSFQGTLAKLGLGADGIKTTPLSGEPDLLSGPSPEADALIQAGVDGIYRRFLGIVAQSRAQDARPRSTASPRAACGTAAPRASSGLVDGFGGMDEAIAKAAELAKLGDERGVRYLERPQSFERQLLEMLAAEDESEATPADALRGACAPRRATAARAALAEVRAILAGPRSRSAASNARRSRRAGRRAADGWLIAAGWSSWLSADRRCACG